MRNELFALLAIIGAYVLTSGPVTRTTLHSPGTNEIWLVFALVFTFAVGMEEFE